MPETPDASQSPPTPALLAAARAGSSEAIATLIARHLPGLRAFVHLRLGPALRLQESESDLVQSVCADLLVELAHVEYRGEAQFRNWLYTAVVHKICKKQRRYGAMKRRAGSGAHDLDEALLANSHTAISSPSHHAIQKEQVDRLAKALDLLPAHYREVITLSRIVGLSQEQVAAAMDCSVAAMRNLLHRALVKLTAAVAQVR